MRRIVFVTGGARSGKSVYALRRAEALDGPRVFVATGTPFDAEMRDRIGRHKRDRRSRLWKTVEEPMDLPGALRKCARFPVVLVDCLSLWVNNLLYEAARRGRDLEEDAVARRMERALSAFRRQNGTAFIVSNEVTLGIVPENKTARRYRDLLGRCNQVAASAAAEVVLLVSGVPLTIKGEDRL